MALTKYVIQASKKGQQGSLALGVVAKDLNNAYFRANEKLKESLRQKKIPSGFKLTSIYNIVNRGFTKQSKTSISLAKKYK